MGSVVYDAVEVDNLKCAGCATTVERELMRIEGVDFVKVNLEDDSVRFMYDEALEETKSTVLKKLKQLGYPLRGTSTKFDQAKSYLSCAVGRWGGADQKEPNN